MSSPPIAEQKPAPSVFLTVADHLVLGACAWETVAMSTGALPTVSRGMWRLPAPLRAAVWLGVAVVLTDHLFTRRWT